MGTVFRKRNLVHVFQAGLPQFEKPFDLNPLVFSPSGNCFSNEMNSSKCAKTNLESEFLPHFT